MGHDTHHKESEKIGSSFTSSIWFMLVLAVVFIAAVNFVSVMSHDDGGHGESHGTEHAAPAGHGEAPHDGGHGHEEAHPAH